MMNKMELINHITDPSLIHHASPQSTALPASFFTIRNTLLVQQISEAKAEAIPKLPMQQDEILALCTMWKWTTATFKSEGTKKTKQTGSREMGRRECACHNELL